MQQTQWSDVTFKDNYSILKNKIITRGNYPKKILRNVVSVLYGMKYQDK